MSLRDLLVDGGLDVQEAPIPELDDELETLFRFPDHYLYETVCLKVYDWLGTPEDDYGVFQERFHELLVAALPDLEDRFSGVRRSTPRLEANPIDWAGFWAEDHEQDWVIEPAVPQGSLVALYAKAKAGKSLLALEWSAALATGRAVLQGEARDPVHVVYIDVEMTQIDLKERLSDLGYGPDDDLSYLHYYSLQYLPPLDTKPGGDALLAIAIEHNAELVVCDTMSRVISGNENDADTFLALYRYTQMPLKAAGIASLWLDHSGKDETKGQRGSSAKDQVADVVWQLKDETEKVGEGRLVSLRARASRPQLPAASLKLIRKAEPLRHELVGRTHISQRAIELMRALDGLDVPRDAGRDRARDALSKSGKKASTAHLAEAIRWRKRYSDSPKGHVPRTVDMDTSGQVARDRAGIVDSKAELNTDRPNGQPKSDLSAAGASP